MNNNGATPPKGQCDPGWNDPPKMEYGATPSTGKTKLNLNKRVAFPWHSGANTAKPTAVVQPSPSSLPLTMTPPQHQQQSSPLVAVVPPMMHMSTPPTMKVSPLNNASDIEEMRLEIDNVFNDLSNEEVRSYCMNTFLNYSDKLQETNSIRLGEVRRRINLMSEMWLSGTLTTPVHKKLYKIAKALESSSFNEAMENHRALVVDHINICTAWGPALRQVILSIQNCSEMELETTESSPNYMQSGTSNVGNNDGD